MADQQTTTTTTETPKPKFGEAALAAAKAAKEAVSTPAQVAPVETPTVVKELTAKEIMARASGAPALATTSSDITIDDVRPSNDELSKLDPVTRKAVEEKLKHLEAGFNKKYQAVADLRKKMEADAANNDTWTPQRLQQYLQRPDFIQAAQALQQQAAPQQWTGSTEEWSALTDGEKGQFMEMNQRLHRQESQMNEILTMREDELLKQQYPDYDPQLVNKLKADLISGSYQATRADIWKVANFESAVERAYRLGKEDAAKDRNERSSAASITPNGGGMNVTPANEVPDDVRKGGIAAIGRWRLQQFRNKK